MAPFIDDPEDHRPNLDQNSTVIKPPERFYPHEAEYVDTISPVIFSLGTGQRKWNVFRIYKAHAINQELGKKLRADFLDLHAPLNTLQGRVLTFPAYWRGADPQEVALAGLHYDDLTGDVRCVVCGVRFRGLNRPGACPWKLHGELVPNCRQLKRYRADGHRPTPAAKRLRHSSTSAAMDMTSEH